MQKNKITFYSCLAALTLHGLLFFLVIICFHLVPNSLILGDKNSAAIHTYFYHSQPTPPPIIAMPRSTKIIQTVKHSAMLIKNSPPPILIAQQKVLSQSNPEKNLSATTTSSLLTLLHRAIQNQQHYPEGAIEMEQQGRISVAFTLFVDGTINNLHLTNPSAIKSLNTAALAAVQDAVPFVNVDKYLKQPQEFTIDVIFELPDNATATA